MKHDELSLTQQLNALYLLFMAEHYQPLADEAARQQWTSVQYLARLIEGETQRRHDRQIVRRVPGQSGAALSFTPRSSA